MGLQGLGAFTLFSPQCVVQGLAYDWLHKWNYINLTRRLGSGEQAWD